MTNEASSYFNFIGWKFDIWIQVIYESWAVSFNSEKESFFTAELKNLTTMQIKTSLQFNFNVTFFATIYIEIVKLCAVFKLIFAKKKLSTQHKML